ncbi:MAG: HU family DNA-binding protein [Myxococcales bacterium]
MAGAKRMTKAQIMGELADKTGLTKKEISNVFDALRDLVKKELGRRGPGEFVVPDMIKLKVRKIPAKPARMGRNPATGEEMMLPPKPASKKIRATPLKKLKDLVL